ncbi:MAG: hypothetical protein HON78_03730 [Legionellales bacterium]|jgi:hypothetical protein|nr:hypothetical protein [Legionellales bacterium]
MTDPIRIGECPEAIDRSALNAWRATGKNTCPFTRNIIEEGDIRPAEDIILSNKDAVEGFVEREAAISQEKASTTTTYFEANKDNSRCVDPVSIQEEAGQEVQEATNYYSVG